MQMKLEVSSIDKNVMMLSFGFYSAATKNHTFENCILHMQCKVPTSSIIMFAEVSGLIPFPMYDKLF